MDFTESDPDHWQEIAFSYRQIEEFLRITALAEPDAMALFNGNSPQQRCFGVGFYFFVNAIKGHLQPEFGNELHNLACRVEQVCMHPTLGSWSLNSEEASRLLGQYFAQADLPAKSTDEKSC